MAVGRYVTVSTTPHVITSLELVTAIQAGRVQGVIKVSMFNIFKYTYIFKYLMLTSRHSGTKSEPMP